MEIVISVNGRPIDRIEIRNTGPVGGEYADGDHPGGMGEREYQWRASSSSGTVRHHRKHGAHALAAKVLAETK